MNLLFDRAKNSAGVRAVMSPSSFQLHASACVYPLVRAAKLNDSTRALLRQTAACDRLLYDDGRHRMRTELRSSARLNASLRGQSALARRHRLNTSICAAVLARDEPRGDA